MDVRGKGGNKKLLLSSIEGVRKDCLMLSSLGEGRKVLCYCLCLKKEERLSATVFS